MVSIFNSLFASLSSHLISQDADVSSGIGQGNFNVFARVFQRPSLPEQVIVFGRKVSEKILLRLDQT